MGKIFILVQKMSQLLNAVTKKHLKSKVPDLKIGYHVKVHKKIKEGNKERVQVFEGLVIRKNSGYGINETFTVRKVSMGIGVEKVFPIHSPSIVKIEVLRAYKIRRAKLHFLRNRSGKALRLPEVDFKLSHKEFKQEHKTTDEKPVKEETSVVSDDKKVAQEEVVKEEKVETKVEEKPATAEFK